MTEEPVVERICPDCQAANPAHQRFCGTCGASLEQPLRRWAGGTLARRSINIPLRWRQTGRVMALGLATLAAEAGLAWLQRQQHTSSQATRSSTSTSAAHIYALQQRITERWSKDQLLERTVEQTVWLRPDQQQ